MTLEDVKKALDMNPNLTDELRDNIFGLINIFNSKYPDVSLNNLVNNLQTLNIIKSNKFVNKRISKYNFLTNTIEFNISKIEEGKMEVKVINTSEETVEKTNKRCLDCPNEGELGKLLIRSLMDDVEVCCDENNKKTITMVKTKK